MLSRASRFSGASRLSRTLVLSSAISVVASATTMAADGTWTNAGGGDWSTTATGNWAGGTIASGAGAIANFNGLDLNGQVNVNLAESMTAGTLNFLDTNVSSSGGYTLGGSPLVIAINATTSPIINVGALASDASIQIDSTLTNLAGSLGGFTKNGAGTLRLGDGAIPTTFTGTINHNGGTINTLAGFANAINVGTGANVTIVTRVNGAFGPVGAAGAGAVLNVLTELPFGTTNANGNWATGTALSRLNVGTTFGSGDGQGYFMLRSNGGTFGANSFQTTHVDIANTIMWTRTNSGGNTIQIGALSGDATSVLSGGGQGGGTEVTYVVGGLNTNTTFAGNIDITSAPTPFGGLNLTKVGTGTLTLSGTLGYQPTANANASRRGGATNINAGTLKLTGNAAIAGGINDGVVGDVYSIVNVAAAGTLDVSGASSTYSTANLQRLIGTGNIVGNYRHDEGQLGAGDTQNGTTNNINAVAGTLNFANNLTIDGGTILYDLTPNPNAGNDKINVVGTLDLGGSASVVLNFIGGANPGTYTVATAASVTGSAAGWTIPWGGRGDGPTLNTTATALQLVIPSVGTPQEITWTGSTSNTWDVNTTFNWRHDGTGAADKYYQQDTVTFADTAGGNPVTVNNVAIAATVNPIDIKVTSNTVNYTFSGSGKITGNAKLTKSGASTLTIQTVNDYLGGTTITGGVVDIGSTATAFGATSSGVSLSNATIKNAGVAVNNTLTVPAGATGTLDYNGAPSTSALATWGGVAGDGQLNIIGVASGRLLDFGTTTAFTGDIAILPSVLGDLSQGTFKVRLNGGGQSFPNSHVTLGNGATLTNRATSAQTIDIGQLTGAAGSILKGYEGGSTATASTFRVGALNNDSVFSGTITNATGSSNSGAATHLLKVGNGSLTLNGTVTKIVTSGGTTHLYSGNVSIQAGTLVLGPNMHKVIFGDSGVDVALTPGGSDVRGGKLKLDYTGGSSPASAVLAILDAGYDLPTKFATGAIRSTTLGVNRILGWKDTGTSVDIAYTIPGDTDLNFAVNFDDLLSVAQHYDVAGTGKVWSQGDVNYNGIVDFDDLLSVAQNYGGVALNQTDAETMFGSAFASDWAMAMSLVPEPASLGLIAGTMLIGRRRRA